MRQKEYYESIKDNPYFTFDTVTYDPNPEFLKDIPEQPSCYYHYMHHFNKLNTMRTLSIRGVNAVGNGMILPFPFCIPYDKIVYYIEKFIDDRHEIVVTLSDIFYMMDRVYIESTG